MAHGSARNAEDLVVALTIANGASLSAGVNIAGYRVAAIIMPSAWTAAALTFQGSPDGGTAYQNIYDDSGAEVTVQAAASRNIGLSSNTSLALAGYKLIKVRSGPSSGAVNQGADRAISLLLLPA